MKAITKRYVLRRPLFDGRRWGCNALIGLFLFYETGEWFEKNFKPGYIYVSTVRQTPKDRVLQRHVSWYAGRTRLRFCTRGVEKRFGRGVKKLYISGKAA